MLRRSPVIRLSIAITLNPSLMKRSQRCEPRKPAPPVISTVFVLSIDGSSSDADILITQLFHQVEIIQVSSVEDHPPFQNLVELFKIGGSELRPFGYDQDSIGPLGGLVRR